MAPRAPAKPLLLTRGAWQIVRDKVGGDVQLIGRLEMHNLTRGSEVFLPEISAKVQLLSAAPTNEITVVTKVIPRHGDGTGYPSFDSGGARHDGYWSVFILKPRTFTVIQVEIKLSCGR
eukprot:CAMPEP_0177782002 /NCGR_PEP_ID=MMETSP0491_2-20121128/18191_1 /TAXON_ID=63592 /ORGANISM="Tetraselmis chuii, Strain PLY429" /LENGTH=118 /DNA_ID=CAMNT_0019302185 /DNA_START=9 /DNA_END=361 /DNA_ORIENTATION=+